MATLGGNLSLPHSQASIDAKYHLQDTGTVGSEVQDRQSKSRKYTKTASEGQFRSIMAIEITL